ncbi:MAG: SusC/RagA family TonB-linked outer membrane protein, partial [Bacteroidota bacterium]
MKNFFTLCIALLSICIFQVSAQAQITGKVTDSEDGSGLPGVNVIVKGTSTGTTTDVNGNYSINASTGQVLVFTYVGYLNQEFTIGSTSVINVSLVSDTKVLEDVVVVGYGEQDKKDVTGAINSIKSEDFNQGVIASPEQLIQGRSAGVQIAATSGEPGAAVSIRIRGTSSITNTNNPLFVLDGVPLISGSVTGAGIDAGLGSSSARNPLNFINPNDIASIDILKDASATAIYGSRGANGVVIITTKKGNGLGKGLQYSSSVSFATITKKYDLLDRDAFIAGNAALGGSATDGGANTDWQDEILRTAVSNNHNISFGDGNANGNYFLSLSYSDQQGIVQESGLRRVTARFNATKKFLNDRLTVGSQIIISDIKDENAPITDNAGFEGDLLGNALKFNPTQPVRNPDGTFFQPGVTEINPVAMLAYNEDFTNLLRTFASVTAAYEFFDGFSFKTLIGVDRSFANRTSAWSRDLVSPQVDGVGRLFIGDNETNVQLWENYFTLDRQFGNV